ncbi:MAG: hypothetical protein OEV44_13620, partial [Spirochaetota bacterium]|nr:hypothetical protein [Spirochaetota bacterium]
MINNNKYAHRVVITGIGIASPLGNTCEDLKHALINGKSAVNKITRFDASDLDTKIAAETSLPDDYIADNPDHKSRFMYWAANNAFNMSCLNGDDINEFYKPNDRLIS